MLSAEFFFTAIVLPVTYVYLISKINEFMGKNKNDMFSFKEEQRSLKIIFGVFSVSYVIRSIWVIIVSRLGDRFSLSTMWLMEDILFIIYDVIPITLILVFHFINFKPSHIDIST